MDGLVAGQLVLLGVTHLCTAATAVLGTRLADDIRCNNHHHIEDDQPHDHR